MHPLRLTAVLLSVVPAALSLVTAATVEAGSPSPWAHVTIKTCSTTNCSANCTSYDFPTGQCHNGAIYTCGPSLSQCIDLTKFNATTPGHDVCNASTFFGYGSAVCDSCYAIRKSDNSSQYMHGILRGCSTDATRVFHHECDAQCMNCAMRTPLPLHTCTRDPLTNDTLVATRVHSCNELVYLSEFEHLDCTGSVTTQTVVMADSCFQDSLRSSTDFMCSLH